MCVVKDRSPHTGKLIDETVPSWPYLLRAELLVFMLTMLVVVAWGLLADAPLTEPANPAVPENPAKAPWYFLGIIFNPGSLLTAACALYSLAVPRRSGSTRMGAIALLTCFLVGFAILTYVGTFLRGPNWDFFWSSASWPLH